MAVEYPARIGSYHILGVLGTGRLGTVYRAYDETQARVVTIRTLSPSVFSDPTRLEKFRRQTKALAALNHPNIAGACDGGQDGDLLFNVCEYVDGSSLEERLRSARPTLAEAIRIVRDVATGLAAAHAIGIVHGDLSPRSVLVSRDLTVIKITDFGHVEADLEAGGGAATVMHARLGSLLYRAPELLRPQASPDTRSDVYSLGVIAYETLTGKMPVGRFGLPSDVNRQVSLQLDPVVVRCLSGDPAQRYPSVSAFLADLDKVRDVVDSQVISELKNLTSGRLFKSPPKPPFAVAASRTPTYVGLALVALIAVIVTASLVMRKDSSTPDAQEVQSAQPAGSVPAGSAAPSSAPAVLPPPVAGSAASGSGTTPEAEPAPAAAATPPAAPADLPASQSALPGPPSATVASEPPAERRAATVPQAAARRPAPVAAPAARPAGPVAAPAAPIAAPAAAPAVTRPDPDVAASALFSEAQALVGAKNDREARSRLATIAESYSGSSWFVPAMTQKIAIEERGKLKEFDPVVGASVPASLLTRRLLAERAPQHPTAEDALWRLGEIYDDMKQYPLAAQAYTQLGTRFPNTKRDAWFKAGEIYERRLKDKEGALAAYLKVPATSSRYRDARNRTEKLADR